MAEFWENDTVANPESEWWKQDSVKSSTAVVEPAPVAPTVPFVMPEDPRGRNPSAANPAWQGVKFNDSPLDITKGLPFHKLAVSAETVQDAWDVLKSMQERSGRTMQERLEGTNTPATTGAKITAGAVAAGLTVPEAATSPLGIATLGAGAAGATAARVVSGAFAADMLKNTPEQVVDVYEAFKLDLGPEEATKRIGALTLNTAMLAATAKHAARDASPGAEAGRILAKNVEQTEFVKPGDLLSQPNVLEVAAVKAESAGAPATAEAVRAQAIETKVAEPISPPAAEPASMPPVADVTAVNATRLQTAAAVEKPVTAKPLSELSEQEWQDTRHVLRRTLEDSRDPEVRKYLEAELSKFARTYSEQVAQESPPTKPASNPEIIGMGGAIPAEFDAGRGTATGIKNAQVDKERVSRGQEPILGPMRQGTQDVWDRVMAKIDTDPAWQDRLIEEAQTKPRALTPDETLALDHRYVDLQNEYAKATRDGAQHYADKYQPGVEEASARAAFYEGKLNELEQLAKKVGTESGRSLQMRKQLIKEDFTLAVMESKMRAAKGFEPLTAQEHAEVAALHEKLVAAEKSAAESELKSSERIAILEAEKALSDARAVAATGPSYEPRVLQAAEKFAKFMDKQGDEALVRIKARLSRVSAGIDPTLLADIAILGAAKITRGTVDSAKWTNLMVRDLGEWFREHSEEALEASKKIYESKLAGFHKGVDKATVEKVRRATTDVAGRTEDIKKSIQEKAAKADGPPLHSEVQKLVRLLVEKNPKITRDGLIDAVHGILKESLPEITRIEAMDAISGRGKFWTPSQDEVSKKVRDLGAQIRLVAHQIDVAEGRPMPRTGYQPEKLSDAARAEKQKLGELMRQYGVVVTDPAKQLGSALQALKTRLEHEKSDLERRIASNDFSPRKKSREIPLDEDAAKARAEVQILRDEFNRGLERQRYNLKSRAEKIWIGTKEALNLSRAILTSWDVSAVFRQGGFIALGNPVRAARSLGPMFRAFRSEKSAVAIESEIQSRPNAKLYAQSDLFLAPREGARLSAMEEAFMSRLAGRIPGVAGSGRAYITFLNKLRADTFDALHESLTSGKTVTPQELKAIANYINTATGRGKLGATAGAAETLSTVFFSPRLVASRFQLILGEPMYRGSASTRYLVAKEYAKFLTGLATVYALGILAGATVENDPRSSDFGKMKFDNTRVDPMAGLSQVTVLSSRLGFGEMKTLSGQVQPIRGDVQFGRATSASLIGRFLRTKLSPIVGTAVDIVTGENVVGEEVTAGSVAKNLFTPLSMGDIYNVMVEQGIPAGTAFGILSLFGMSVQNYQAGKKKP